RQPRSLPGQPDCLALPPRDPVPGARLVVTGGSTLGHNRGEEHMRIESSVTSISWIPSEAVTVPSLKATFELGLAHYDQAPPDHIDDLEVLRQADRFRFANELRAFIDVDSHGAVTKHGYLGSGHIGSTTLRLA